MDSIEVPSELKKYEIPQDFNKFLVGLQKNMYYFVGVKVNFDVEKINSILQEFVIYMLEKDKHDRVRYKVYDVVNYPKIPYYKWFLKNLNYFVLNNWRKIKKDFIYFQFEEERDVEDIINELLIKNPMCYSMLSFDQSDTILFMKEINNFLKKHSEKINNNFDLNAYNLFIFKMEGYSNSDLAYLLDIHITTVGDWIKRLRKLIVDYLNMEIMQII